MRRGATFNPLNTITSRGYVPVSGLPEDLLKDTTYYIETPRKILNEICSPDLPYGYSLNPYQGCEHGCVYCYARERHQYYDLSAGLDFEQIIFCKVNAAELLAKEINSDRYIPRPINISGNTDPYQPVERHLCITRKILQVLYDHHHPFTIVTKNSLILRDMDILAPAARENLCYVCISITTLDEDLRRKMEPRASSVDTRLKTIETLSENGIHVHVLFAPVIPHLNDHEAGKIIEEVRRRGASSISYSFVRLNGPIADIFTGWLECHFPSRKNKILETIKGIHGGSLEDRRFFLRHSGEGKYASLFNQTFLVFLRRIWGYVPEPPHLSFARFKKRTWLF